MSEVYTIDTQEEYNTLFQQVALLDADIVTVETALYDALMLDSSDQTRLPLVAAKKEELLIKTLRVKIIRRALDVWRYKPLE